MIRSSREDLPHDLRLHLGRVKPRIKSEWDARLAAVLVPLYWDQDEWHVLYTRRTDEVQNHQGQVSFPGGLIEGDDPNPEEAALREAQEEIGVKPADVDILGQLDSLMTVTQFHIIPIVGIIPWPYPLLLNKREVARAFGVPLAWLADEANIMRRERMPLASGPNVTVYYYHEFEGETIWGATARITLNLLSHMAAL